MFVTGNSLFGLCVLATFLIFSTCKTGGQLNNPHTPYSNDLVGKWRLIETLVSPGSVGTWQKVSEKTPYEYVQFKSDSLVSSNIYLAVSYSVKDSLRLVLTLEGKKMLEQYYKIKGDTLILNSACFEPCGSKFLKIH